ncbi:MAG: helix-turn-helix domain-containing protein [Candidatus Krumholzibacteriia bacterium]
MITKKKPDRKAEALRSKGSLNPRPARVTDPLFQENEFFDARDMVQVKYEMLRRVRAEGQNVTAAAGTFGMSRFSFYEAQGTFQQEGLSGLIPKKPGPRGRHKMTDEVMAFLKGEIAKGDFLQVQDCISLVKKRFGLTVHRRTLERALGASKKKRR